MITLLLACGGGAGDGQEWPVADFLLGVGVHLEHAPLDQPELPSTTLEAVGTTWEIRGDDVESFAVETGGEGLVIDGEVVLPSALTVGKGGVTDLGEHETWYGTFPRAVTVEVAGGRWAGTQVFAEHLGPVTYTLDGEVRDLVYYERAIAR